MLIIENSDIYEEENLNPSNPTIQTEPPFPNIFLFKANHMSIPNFKQCGKMFILSGSQKRNTWVFLNKFNDYHSFLCVFVSRVYCS